MNKELYVSTTPHETKVALVEDDQLAEVYFERENEYTLAGSIYKGRVTRVLPGMQSAFVDIGLERDAFLYVSDFLDLQDEDDEGEFGDVKVTGQSLATANGLILPEPQPAAEEEGGEEEEAESSDAAAAPQGEAREGGRWRGRRRRRGRRGGRDRNNGEARTGEAPGTEAAGEESAEPEDDGEATPERKRELRGFEPRGLVEHGLARNAEEAEGAEEDFEVEESEAAAPAASASAVLPGESISKYRGGASTEAPAVESSEEESERPAREGRERHGRFDRRGRRDGRGRRERGDREPRESREPRSRDESPLPSNYTPIILPGESISKYRGVEPVAGYQDPREAEVGAESPEVETEPIEHTRLGDTAPETVAEASAETTSAPEPVAETPAAEPKHDNPDEPLSSASYSGASGLPSLRYTPEAEPEAESAHTAEEHPEAAPAEPAAEAAVEPEAAPEATQPEESTPSAEAAEEPRPEGRPRRSWRDRVSKIFGNHAEAIPAEAPAAAEEEEETEDAAAAEEVPAVEEPRRPRGRSRRGRGAGRTPVEPKPAEQNPAEPTPDEHLPGSFILEGGNVEHEELDDEEADMPALDAHRDRYQEDEEDEGDASNGSMIGSTVRESGEESDLEDEEYDFGGEEFEESELVASEAAEGAEEDEEEGEEEAEGEEAAPGAAPQPGRQRRFERRGRRDGRRGAPQRGGGRGRPRQQTRALPLISELLKEGQEILVQIAKEPINKKGARITSHIALPGRFLVYMPTVNHIGVSRKINSDEERQRLKRIVSSERENGHGGFIVRTAAANIKEDELRADIRFLKHLWSEIRTRAEGSKSPALIYHDLNLVERVLRDQVTSDFSQIWVDNEAEYERVVRFASRFQSNLVRRIKLYTKDTPLFEQFGIQEEINKSLKSKVWLKSGGYIVINQTEALVAIDINTGKYVGKTSRLEDTIVKTNIDAVKEIVRQVRLRDLGGIIIVDFIDMDERKNRQRVMQALEEAMKSDRAPSKILQFNDFGLVAITRKRVKQSLERTLGTPCPYCDSTGFVKSVQTVCNEIYVEMRKIRRHVEDKDVVLRVNPEVARELKSGNGRWLTEMEELLGHPVIVKSDAQLHQEKFDMNY